MYSAISLRTPSLPLGTAASHQMWHVAQFKLKAWALYTTPRAGMKFVVSSGAVHIPQLKKPYPPKVQCYNSYVFSILVEGMY